MTEEWYSKSHLRRVVMAVGRLTEIDSVDSRSNYITDTMSQATLRLERFKQAQAALAPSLRIENRNDLDVTHQKHHMESTLKQHRSAKKWFI